MTAGGEERRPAVLLRAVDFTWNGRTPFRLEVPDLSIEAGSRVFLHGDSGSGKSTLLSLICGIVAPASGSVIVDGVDLGSLSGPSRDRFRAERIGVIFQMFNLLPYATPLDNILLPLSFAPRRSQAAGRPVEEALRLTDQLGLPGDLIRSAAAADLSVGQQQRVAVARALIGSPPLIVADEPTSSLDSSAQESFLDLLFEQVDGAGLTLLMVSHDQRLADRFDRTIDLGAVARVSRGEAP